MRIYAYNIINEFGKDVIIMRETRILEFKETITNTFLKTVSAFSNYDGGTILFGVDDDGNVKGLADVKQARSPWPASCSPCRTWQRCPRECRRS